eukprot:CAMPEP_0167830192 /NCGR_PEP_ID=MMETSP0112_2-20121227/12739_1 /TAXON_ID=91324 /ORGANISM="Lotharella globosa, Strain CCCM811" /LENGTH=50 /DNA_ID=CAMNT_0007734291 /DNA_START=512 /DNA_END=664 /DNA_ORIENTATION=+
MPMTTLFPKGLVIATTLYKDASYCPDDIDDNDDSGGRSTAPCGEHFGHEG